MAKIQRQPSAFPDLGKNPKTAFGLSGSWNFREGDKQNWLRLLTNFAAVREEAQESRVSGGTSSENLGVLSSIGESPDETLANPLLELPGVVVMEDMTGRDRRCGSLKMG
jgi:hypothetical protein